MLTSILKIEKLDLEYNEIHLFESLRSSNGGIMVVGQGILIKSAVDAVGSVCRKFATPHYGQIEICKDGEESSSKDSCLIKIPCKRVKNVTHDGYRKPRDVNKEPWKNNDPTVYVGKRDSVVQQAFAVLDELDKNRNGYAFVRGLGGSIPNVVAITNIVLEEIPGLNITEIEIGYMKNMGYNSATMPINNTHFQVNRYTSSLRVQLTRRA